MVDKKNINKINAQKIRSMKERDSTRIEKCYNMFFKNTAVKIQQYNTILISEQPDQ